MGSIRLGNKLRMSSGYLFIVLSLLVDGYLDGISILKSYLKCISSEDALFYKNGRQQRTNSYWRFQNLTCLTPWISFFSISGWLWGTNDVM